MKGTIAAMLLTAGCCAQAVKPVASVAAADAVVTTAPGGLMPVIGGRTLLPAGSTVTAREGRNAEVLLARGGSVLVCQTSGVHVSANDNSLLLGLDRGAMEIRMSANSGDVVMTPDLRFVTSAAGPLDLRLRVTLNGDTCVENRGRKAPLLEITDSFGEASYEVKPGQHVLFEHGNLHQVVDRETTPCGCPPSDPAAVPLAEALLRGGTTKVTPQQAEAAHPFPTAISDGLAAPGPPTITPDGERHVQVATALKYDPTVTAGDKTPEAPIAPSPATPTANTPKHGPFAAIGHFFKRLFVR